MRKKKLKKLREYVNQMSNLIELFESKIFTNGFKITLKINIKYFDYGQIQLV